MVTCVKKINFLKTSTILFEVLSICICLLNFVKGFLTRQYRVSYLNIIFFLTVYFNNLKFTFTQVTIYFTYNLLKILQTYTNLLYLKYWKFIYNLLANILVTFFVHVQDGWQVQSVTKRRNDVTTRHGLYNLMMTLLQGNTLLIPKYEPYLS